MIEKVKAKKLIAICEDIAKSLKTYVDKDPNQEILFQANRTDSTHVLEVVVIGKGHTLNRTVDYKEHF